MFRPKAPTFQQELSRDPLRNFGPHCKFDLDLPAIDGLLANDFNDNGTANTDRVVSSTLRTPFVSHAKAPSPQLVTSRASPSSPSTVRTTPAVGPKPKPSLPSPLPGKRPEIAAFDIAVVWHDDDEYCRWETRARADGLLGKKWALPPHEAAGSGDLVVPLKNESRWQTRGGGSRRSAARTRQSTTGKLTSSPTTNTKAALNDVFDMFNITARLEDTLEGDDDVDGLEDHTTVAPVPLTIPAKVAWTPLVENGIPKSTPPVHPCVPDMPQAGSSSANRRVETPREAQVSMRSSARSPAKKFTVFRESTDEGPTPTLQPDTAPCTISAAPRSARTPAKFTVFLENGENRLPSAVKSVPAAGATPLAQKSFPQREEARCESPSTGQSSATVPHFPSIPADVDSSAESCHPTHEFVSPTPAGSLLSQSAEPDPNGPDMCGDSSRPQPLVFRKVEPYLEASSDVVRIASPRDDDVFTNNEPSGAVETEEIAQGDAEGSYVEDELAIEDIHPRSYEMRGGVAIMTPITERTLEYETHTRGSLVASAQGSVVSAGGEGGRILDGLDASPRSSRRRSCVRPSLMTRRRSSIRPRASTIKEDTDEDQDACLDEPINPFKAEYVQAMLDAVWDELDHSMYRDMRNSKSTYLGEFEAFAKKRASRSGLGRSRSEASIPPMTFELGDAEYALLDKIGEGGFGAVFLAEDLAVKELAEENPEDYLPGYELVALKTVRPSMLWEYAVLHVLRSSLPPVALDSIIAPREFYHFSDESHLVMDYSGQGTLLDAVNHAAQMHVNAHDTSGLDELLIMFFGIELIRSTRFLHGEHFIHGDLKIDNCLLRLADPAEFPLELTYDHTGEGGWAERGIKLIDFGRTIDVDLFEPGQAFIGDWPTDARDCVDMREGRPWTYQTDYAGLAGIIYCMMFGKYIETIEVPNPNGIRRFKVSTPLKRYWQTDIWNRLFDVLLNPTLARHDGTLPLVDELGAIEDDMANFLTTNCERGGKSLRKMLNQMHQYTKNNSPHTRR